MLGPLTLNGAPTVDLHAATKKYVDDAVAGAGSNPYALHHPYLVGAYYSSPFIGSGSTSSGGPRATAGCRPSG